MQQVQAEGLHTFFALEVAELEKEEKALGRILKIRASERELEAQQKVTAGKQAIQNGADPNAVAAQNLETQTNDRVTALKESLAKVASEVATAERTAVTLELAAKTFVEREGEGGKNALEATKKATEARAAAEESKADLEQFTITTSNQIQTTLSAGKANLLDVSKAGIDSLKEAAQKERDALKEEVNRLGSKSSSGAREALATLEKVLEDSVIKPEELAPLQQALFRVRGAQEINNNLVREGFEATQKSLSALVTTINPIVSKIQDLESKIRIIGSRPY